MTYKAELAFFQYRERMHLSYAEASQEPWEEVQRALFIWSKQDERDKLEADRQAMSTNARSQQQP